LLRHRYKVTKFYFQRTSNIHTPVGDTYWVNNSFGTTFSLRANLFPEFPRSFNRTAAGSFMLLPVTEEDKEACYIIGK
jgi:hypothetical protein